MADPQDRETDASLGKRSQARQLADRAIALEAAGDQDGADALFAEASRADPDAVAAALSEAASLRPSDIEPAGQDEAIERMSREVRPSTDAPDRQGISGNGSGADAEKR